MFNIIDNHSVVNMFCKFQSSFFKQFKTERLFERIIIAVFGAAFFLSFASSLTADEPFLTWGQADPFSEQNRAAGDRAVKVINGVEFAFRWCPAGKFTMGSPKSEEGRKNDEQQHQVTLSKGFWMMETEVTQEQWQIIMGNNPSWIYNNKNAVHGVSWNDCQLFCQKCTAIGLPIQLPTEAQWEYACRAGTTGAYAGEVSEMGWYRNSDGIATAVKLKKPNQWGLYDMHGNVCELCSDWYGPYPQDSVSDPEGPASGIHRVMRGGCYQTTKEYCRSANRSKCNSDFSAIFLGFRCVIGKGVPMSYVPPVKPNKAISNDIRISNFGQGTEAGERKTAILNGVEFAFRWCPPGSFMMGSPESEEGRNGDETRHEVTLSKGFWIMETEVSQEQWQAIARANIFPVKGDKLPATCLNWFICREFCLRCAQMGLPLQLPTEAQWEYACRAGATGAYPGKLSDIAWYKENCGFRMHPVGKKKPNAWGLYDMIGNADEWCQDWYGAYPDESDMDPEGSPNGSERVARGGDIHNADMKLRSAFRDKGDPKMASENRGFRCVICP